MIDGWVIIAAAITYLGILFAVAYYGDLLAARRSARRDRPTIYALSLAVYCTSWTFFGSIGLSARTGLDFLPVYVGPILVLALGTPLISRIIRISKTQNITSVADFLAARYGKSAPLAAVVTVLIVMGTLPYLSLQLEAVSVSVKTMLGPENPLIIESGPTDHVDIAFIIAVLMATFAMLFGTRHIDATEHQEGLMLAIAMESVVKLVAFIVVGAYITFVMMGGIGPLLERAAADPEVSSLFSRGFSGGTWMTITLLSAVCIILLPRQFHVMVVENNAPSEVRRASWLFPLYLILINLFVVPVAIAGLLTFGEDASNADMYLLSLPLNDGAQIISLIAFLGGLSAATAMVIVASVALSIMVCNDLVVPLILQRRRVTVFDRQDMGRVLLHVRRSAIFIILLLTYVFYHMIGGSSALASIGLLSFAAIAQLAPAFFGGLMWRGATARGALAGIFAGFAIWAYTLLLPFLARAGEIAPDIVENGPFGISLLRPEMLFNMSFEPLTHGVFWSLIFNIIAYVSVSLLRPPEPIERLQGTRFIDERQSAPTHGVRPWREKVNVADLRATVARYLGEERTTRCFQDYALRRGAPLSDDTVADIHWVRFSEKLLASAIGAASSRLVFSLALRRHDVGSTSALKLLDDASEAIQYNRDLLQQALDQVRQGIAVFDKDMRLICWNRQFREILCLPPELGQVGVPLDQIVRVMAQSGDLGPGETESIVADRLRRFVVTMETFQERLNRDNRVIEVRTNAMPQGGIVTSMTDITDRVAAAEALERSKAELEHRVRERTAELTKLNEALKDAKARADEANLDKTRFLAAASHDILQPLNAARLYATSLVERDTDGENGRLAGNVDAALTAVEDILNTLLDISRLDTGALRPEFGVVSVNDLLKQLKLEFEPMAQERGLKLIILPSTLWVTSDGRLLRRILQNLLSNAVKYTDRGRVLVGCRRDGATVRLEVHDTGPGIPMAQQSLVFKEFLRLDQHAATVRGLGLGLSIVERMGRVLSHPVRLKSRPGSGSVFSVTVPLADAEAITTRPAAETSRPVGDMQGVCVLCIDNEAAILEGMEVLLKNWGCEVITAQDASEATVAVHARNVTPHIILADYHLNDGSGCDAIAAICRSLQRDIAGVIVTADRSPEVQDEVRNAGYRLLRKPVKPAALRTAIAQVRVPGLAAE
ncbi:MAG: NahK/ErcS family hybrid sensor histidine kinase/response regulator [Dichotomicrobium sp.]